MTIYINADNQLYKLSDAQWRTVLKTCKDMRKTPPEILDTTLRGNKLGELTTVTDWDYHDADYVLAEMRAKKRGSVV